ncbi:adenine nucleotide alpha hydrolases-like protein [Sphaerulina musiva SO2202]|uniref:FAD synthase n=1 Tax=Sphaerulina musiva (strain SO2202) TaxID=692275 RepID=N1QDC7_SPHMS|nr:adenine nucleotide alpha hydrolases-like protein [Sphaerulina musiva SO2202]EMF09340.1 adenine nucleotide alpha hydrolases-like protein [Sphaerulina musiva SO2202]
MQQSNGVAAVTTDKEHVYHDLGDACKNVHARVDAFLRQDAKSNSRLRQVQRTTRESLDVIEEALERYSLDHLSFSYNGGKDCLVLLILYLAALHTHSTKSTSSYRLPSTLQTVYIVTPNPFPAVTSFVHHSAKKYHLSLQQYHKPMREAFASYLQDHPQIQAIFVGTRRTDPHGAKLTSFDPTDGGWPEFVRIHPVIDWHYADIWSFVRGVGVEYCELYDMGYTSLGGTDDTHPNPALAIKSNGSSTDDDEQGVVRYRPAYELVEDEEERLGRDGRQ